MIEENPTSVSWHTAAETQQLLAMMSPINLAKVNAAKRAGHRMVGGVYKRTRVERGKRCNAPKFASMTCRVVYARLLAVLAVR
jgi:hypothetical protein